MKIMRERLRQIAYQTACLTLAGLFVLSTSLYGSDFSGSCSDRNHRKKPACFDNPNVVADQVNFSDFYLHDQNRSQFYGVFPVQFYAASGGTGFFNTFLPRELIVNPRDPNNIICDLRGDGAQQNTLPGFTLLRRNPFFFSKDGGKTWSESFAPTLHLSQSAAIGGLNGLGFSSNGKTIYALGSFNDTYTNPQSSSNPGGLFDFTYFTSYLPHSYGPASVSLFNPSGPVFENEPSVEVSRNNPPTDPNTTLAATLSSVGVSGTANPAAGIFICRSRDGGKTFSSPSLISATQTSGYFGALSSPDGLSGTISGSNGLVDQAGTLIVDPDKSNILSAVWYRIDNVSFLWGSVYGARSTDGGRSWTSNPTGDDHLPNITNEPLYALEFDQNFQKQIISTDPNYLTNFPNVGQAVSTGSVVVTDVGQGGNKGRPVYLVQSSREYPKPNQAHPTFTDDPKDSLFDHVIIISKDRGKTWGDGKTSAKFKVNGVAMPMFTFATVHDPRLPAPPIGLIVFDGALNQTLAASPVTGRVYSVWEGGNTAVSPDPEKNQFFPNIQMSVSSGSLDVIGQNWTTPVQVNQTPLNPAFPQTSQAFNCNVAVNKNGIVGVIYNDFRNFDLSQIGVKLGTVNTTTWLAFFKELDSPTAGEFGNGLTFIGEIQISPIYNSAVAGGVRLTGISAGGFNGIFADAKGNFVVDYAVTNVNNGVQPIPPNFPPFSSFNIIENTSNRSNTFVKVIPSPCVVL